MLRAVVGKAFPFPAATASATRYRLLRVLIFYMVIMLVLIAAALADDQPADRAIQEEVWAIPLTMPTIAYVVRPIGNCPFRLEVMNHGVLLNQPERSFFPIVEFRDAAMWFARTD